MYIILVSKYFLIYEILQLCVWSTGNWEKKKSRYIRSPSNGSALVGDTMVQFHYNQTHLLVVHESQLTIYDGNLECLHLVSYLFMKILLHVCIYYLLLAYMQSCIDS